VGLEICQYSWSVQNGLVSEGMPPRPNLTAIYGTLVMLEPWSGPGGLGEESYGLTETDWSQVRAALQVLCLGQLAELLEPYIEDQSGLIRVGNALQVCDVMSAPGDAEARR
jgi:hypothetical protein